VLLAVVGILIVLIIIALFHKHIKAKKESLITNIPNTIGGILGFAAVIVVVCNIIFNFNFNYLYIFLYKYFIYIFFYLYIFLFFVFFYNFCIFLILKLGLRRV
jgi:hypothetical protein